MNVERYAVRPVRHQSDEHRASPIGEEHPKGAARERQQDALGEQLPYQSPASCPERQTYGDLALPHAGPRQQQVGHVGAGDEQHQPDHGHQQKQGARKFPAQVVGAPRGGQQHDAMGEEVLTVSLRPV